MSSRWRKLKEDWVVLSYYQRFEGVVAFVLTIVVGLIILVALYRLTSSVMAGLVFGVLDPLEPSAFQTVFGEILTLRIALEFNHTLQYVVKREQSIIQTKVVLLIALLAVAPVAAQTRKPPARKPAPTVEPTKVAPDMIYAGDVLEQISNGIVAAIKEHGRISVAGVRDLTGTSRKYSLALLAYLDERRVTRRVGDDRVLF